jgi:RND family efflux transporter MFP subunit
MAVKSHSITNAPRRWPLLAPWILIIAVLLILPLAGCGDAGSDGANAKADADSTGGGSGEEADAAAKSEDETAEEAKPERKRKERTTSVRVSEAFRGDLVIPVIAEGTIRARHDAELRTELAGRIVRIAVTEGQTMRKGQLIAKLDDREYEVASEEARATYLEAVSLLAIEEVAIEIPERPQDLQAKIDELGDLEAQGVITREERLAREVSLDVNAIKEGHYRLDVLASRSGIAAARAQLERAKLNLERTEIRAPFSGIITGLSLSVGEHVTVNQVICTLVNNTDIEAEVGVLESDIGKLDIGRPALLAIPALNDTVRVKVDVISPQFDSSTRTCRVLLRLQNESGQMRPGMFVRAIISGESFSDRLLVPKEAILTRDGRPLLFKVDGDRAKWLYLKIGQRNDNLVEITGVLQGGSLEPGDRVVVADHLTLAHDAKIKVKKVLPIRDPWGTTE